MSQVAIRVEGLGKRYRLGQQVGYKTLRETLLTAYHTPTRVIGERLLRMRQLPSATRLEPSPMSYEPLATSHEPNHIWALKDVSFEVNRGEAIGIIGRNGSGKSTLLKILSRITAPTEGRAEIRGRVGSLLEVGTGFHPELTGRENIYLNGAIIGMRKTEIDRRFDEIVSFAEIERFLDTPVKRYSSGMYIRLAFAVAAHLEPEILMVDEVLAVGDAEFQKKCLGKLGSVAESGRTVLFVSHNMSAISALCKKAVLLEAGRVIARDEVKEVINKYTLTVTRSSFVDLTLLKHAGPRDYSFLTRLSVFDKALKPCTGFSMGETMIARIGVHITRRMVDAEVGIKISSAMGIAIHYFVSTWEGLRTDLEPGDYILEVEVPGLMLLPGKYLLGAWVLKEGNWSDDNVENITIIEIVGSDITGHSAAFDKYAYSGCEVYAPSRWRFVE
jgi:lipopolysaccharide transport system ATP-binding protein